VQRPIRRLDWEAFTRQPAEQLPTPTRPSRTATDAEQPATSAHLLEEQDLVGQQAEEAMLLKVRERGIVRGGARHHVPPQRPPP
jgi:hypothetical protein